MKCNECKYCYKGWFKSNPDGYVCTGVPEPYPIENINRECTEYKKKTEDLRTEDCLILGFDRSDVDDTMLTVSRIDGKGTVLVNLFDNEEALEIYKRLIGVNC